MSHLTADITSKVGRWS